MNIEKWEAVSGWKTWGETLQKIVADAMQYGVSVYSLEFMAYKLFPRVLVCANTEEKKALAEECERELVACYQRAIDISYAEMEQAKEEGLTDFDTMRDWTLTVDKDGVPKKTTVVSLDERGYPVYADGCKGLYIQSELQEVWNCRYKLNKWIKKSGDLYALRAEGIALLKQGALGMASVPSPAHDLDGLTGERLDAAAWRNYAIENGMYRPTDYDDELLSLLKNIDLCLEFYEKAITIA